MSFILCYILSKLFYTSNKRRERNMDLSNEIMVHTFKYLPATSRRVVNETCKAWRMLVNDYYFMKKKNIVFQYSELQRNLIPPVDIFNKSKILYPNYIFDGVKITSISNNFWETNGLNVKSLTIQHCDIHVKDILYILQKCTKLEHLILNSDSLKCDGINVPALINMLAKYQFSLKSLDISNSSNVTDEIFNLITMKAPLLEDLNFSRCQISVPSQQNFSMDSEFISSISNPSKSNLTFTFIKQFISSRSKQIKHLNFSVTNISDNEITSLMKIKDLHLKSFDAALCFVLTDKGLLKLVSVQKSLRKLNLRYAPGVSDEIIKHLCSTHTNLEYLNIEGRNEISLSSVEDIFKLKKLKTLCITLNSMGTKFIKERNINITKLTLGSMGKLQETDLIYILESLPNIRHLDISACGQAVTNRVVQGIIKNLSRLKSLVLKNTSINDSAFTGGNEHCSKQQDMKSTTSNETGFSLAQLKRLKLLDISHCTNITDESFKYALILPELLSLSLAGCKITEEGLKYLVVNCPHLEYLNITHCTSVTKNTAIILGKGLKNLRHLEVTCPELDIAFIKQHCKSLKCLNYVEKHHTLCSIENCMLFQWELML